MFCARGIIRVVLVSSCRPKSLTNAYAPIMAKRPSSDMSAFREDFSKASHILVLSGAGISAESGVPTFRGAGGLWRRWQAQDLATPEAFARDPSLVWEFYHYRREVMLSKSANAGHRAIADCQTRLAKQGRRVVVVTQNIDELHAKAGTRDVVELHGNLFRTRCLKCGHVAVNRDSPIVPALKDRGGPDPQTSHAQIDPLLLPRCQQPGCDSMVRPHVVWFGEQLEAEVLGRVDRELKACDLCLVVGTSSVVYPAAMFAPAVAMRGVPVAEFNLEETPVTETMGYHFQGPSGVTLPVALAPHPAESTG